MEYDPKTKTVKYLDPLAKTLSWLPAIEATSRIGRLPCPRSARGARGAHRGSRRRVRHLNKNSTARAKHRGSGSIGIIGAVRSALLVGRDPEDPSRRVIAPVKQNLCQPGAAVACSIRWKPAPRETRERGCSLSTSLAGRSPLARTARRLRPPPSEPCDPRYARAERAAHQPCGAVSPVQTTRTAFPGGLQPRRRRRRLAAEVLLHWRR